MGDDELRRWAHLADLHAGRWARIAPPWVSYADLRSWALVGLWEALRRFDAGQGARLEVFAWHRIRGAILDGLRERDWVPIGARARARLDGGDIEPPLSLDGERTGDGGESSLLDLLPDPSGDGTAAADARCQLDRLLRVLPPREAEVVRTVDLRDVAPLEIALGMSVSRSRVSQLRTQALARMRGSAEVGGVARGDSKTGLPIDREELLRLAKAGACREDIAAHFGVTIWQLQGWCAYRRIPVPPLRGFAKRAATAQPAQKSPEPPKAPGPEPPAVTQEAGDSAVAPGGGARLGPRSAELHRALNLDPPDTSRLVATRPSGLPPLPKDDEDRTPRLDLPATAPPGTERPLGWVRRVTLTLPDPATGGRRALHLDTDSAAGVDAAVTFGVVFGFPVHLTDAPPGTEPCRVDTEAAERH